MALRKLVNLHNIFEQKSWQSKRFLLILKNSLCPQELFCLPESKITVAHIIQCPRKLMLYPRQGSVFLPDTSISHGPGRCSRHCTDNWFSCRVV